MKIECLTDLGPRLQPNEIAAFEKQIGFSLPEDYKQFLLATNGGYVPDKSGYFFVRKAIRKSGWMQTRIFFGLRRQNPEEEWCALKNILHDLSDSLPAGTLPIASDDYGNKIYVHLANPKCGKIYFWNHELVVADELIATTFQEFFENLREDPSDIHQTKK